MTPERVKQLAESAWDNDFHSPITDKTVERAIRSAVNEFAEEAIKACNHIGDTSPDDFEAGGAYSCADAIRALKLPEE